MTNAPQQQILQRTVRFSINPAGKSLGEKSFAAKPTINGLGRYYEITLAVKGYPDPQTGYLINIHGIDTIVRDHLVPLIAEQISNDPSAHPATLMPALWVNASAQTKHELRSIRWNLTPFESIEMTNAIESSHAVLVRQRFEFAAAHRLHAPSMSDEENAAFFGKCNNPNGHGHNYQLEPCVRIPIGLLESSSFALKIEHAVSSILLEELDHKFLNTDCPWFDQSAGGVIPSIEHIARVCYEQLAPAISKLGDGVELVTMTAWETEKTASIYPDDAH
jgi:6-pyruvoyltetrahydropterin/6-carboxytetrahydropterin synthase